MNPYRTPAETPPPEEPEDFDPEDYATPENLWLCIAGSALFYTGWLPDIAEFFLAVVLLNAWPVVLFARREG